MPRPLGSLDRPDLLLRCLERHIERVPIAGCWLWTGYLHKDGYGGINFGGRAYRAHRIAYHVFVSPVPEGLFVCHHCDVRACINPAHLFLGTHDDNVADMVAKDRHNLGERNPQSKLTRAQVLAIREADGVQREIAVEYGIHQSQVSFIKSRRHWAHI